MVSDIASAAVLCGIAWFLVENILWFRAMAFQESRSNALIFQMHAHHLHIAMIKRSIGLFSGFALLFLGIGVAFHQLRSKSRYRIQGQVATQSFAAEAVSASPGILAMLLGVVLLLGTIASKDSFPAYGGNTEHLLSTLSTQSGNADSVEPPPLPAELEEKTPQPAELEEKR